MISIIHGDVNSNFSLPGITNEDKLSTEHFMELSLLDLTQTDSGEVEDDNLWITFASMGFNQRLLLDQSCPFVLNVYNDSSSVGNCLLAVKCVDRFGSLHDNAFVWMTFSKVYNTN